MTPRIQPYETAATSTRRPAYQVVQRHTGRPAGVPLLAATLVLGLTACTSATPKPVASTANSTPSSARSCAWPTQLNAQTNNQGGPDSGASYWVQPLVGGVDTRFVISGSLPDARYSSLSVYAPDGSAYTSNGVAASLTDYQVSPATGERYTVTIRSDASASQTNTLPMPPGTTNQHPGYLLYRVYLPAGGDFSRILLPDITVQQGSTRHVLPTCKQHNGPAPIPIVATPRPSQPATAPTPSQLQFYKQTFNGLFPDTDTAYVLAYLVRPPAADVVVVTAKAPTSAPGDHGSPWPTPGEDMRYWSMCVVALTQKLPTVANSRPGGQTDYGCRADEATKRNPAGKYTYVIGTEAQRATIEHIPNVTFLPLSTDPSVKLHFLQFRNMLVSPQFTHSVQNVKQTGDPAAAAAAMGPYYPHATLVATGPQACTP